MSFETDESVVRELELFTENDGDIYRQTATPILRNLITKKARGTYDHERAVQLFMYLAKMGARKYARVHGSGEHMWHVIFPIDVRRQAATHWRDEFEGEAALGNYNHLLPKKYQKKTSRPAKKQTTAFKSGRSDGITYANEESPSRTTVESLGKQGHVPPSESLINAVDFPKLAKVLGLKPTSVTNRTEGFYDALTEYDRGFKAGALTVLDAQEGN